MLLRHAQNHEDHPAPTKTIPRHPPAPILRHAQHDPAPSTCGIRHCAAPTFSSPNSIDLWNQTSCGPYLLLPQLHRLVEPDIVRPRVLVHAPRIANFIAVRAFGRV